MRELQNTVRVFCTACIVGGLILRLFSSSAAKKCIKAVVGLYILATLVRLSQETVLPAPALPELQSDPVPSAQSDFEAAVLGQGKEKLEQYAEQLLNERGIDAQISLTLQSGPAGTCVERILVTGVSSDQESAVVDCLQPLLQPGVILFQDG